MDTPIQHAPPARSLPPADLIGRGVDPEVAARIDRAFALRHQILPFARTADGIAVAVADVDAVIVLDRLASEWGVALIAHQEDWRVIRNAMNQVFASDNCGMAVTAMGSTAAPCAGDPSTDAKTRIEWQIAHAVLRGASDIHCEPEERSMRVRQRIDGALSEIAVLDADEGRAAVARLKVLAHLDLVERRRPQDGRMMMDIGGRRVAFRVSVVPALFGEAVVLRVTDGMDAPVRITDLGMRDETRGSVAAALHSADGMLMIAGPTGAGKSTTAYSVIRELDLFQNKVMSIEDPVEIPMAGVHQIAVQRSVGLGFAEVLRASLRHAPDFILVGETRDAETAEIAVQAALTGHRVLTTVHADDPVAALARLDGLGIHVSRIADAVRGVLAQRLVRRLCPQCARAVPPDPAQRTFIEACGRAAPQRVWLPCGCAHCRQRGVRGRTGLFAWLEVTQVSAPVLKRDWVGARLRANDPQHAATLLDDALAKSAAGIVCVNEALALVGAADAFAGLNTPPP